MVVLFIAPTIPSLIAFSTRGIFRGDTTSTLFLRNGGTPKFCTYFGIKSRPVNPVLEWNLPLSEHCIYAGYSCFRASSEEPHCRNCYDTTRYAIFTCAGKLAEIRFVSLPHGPKIKNKKQSSRRLHFAHMLCIPVTPSR